MTACEHGYFRDVESCALCELIEERDEAQAVARECFDCYALLQEHTAAALAKEHRWLKERD